MILFSFFRYDDVLHATNEAFGHIDVERWRAVCDHVNAHIEQCKKNECMIFSIYIKMSLYSVVNNFVLLASPISAVPAFTILLIWFRILAGSLSKAPLTPLSILPAAMSVAIP